MKYFIHDFIFNNRVFTGKVYIGVYDHNGNPLPKTNPMCYRVTCPTDPSDIIKAAKEIYRLSLEGVEAGAIEVHQLKGGNKLVSGRRIILSEMATLLACDSDITAGACLACVIPGSLFIYYCNNLHAMMVFLYDISS